MMVAAPHDAKTQTTGDDSRFGQSSGLTDRPAEVGQLSIEDVRISDNGDGTSDVRASCFRIPRATLSYEADPTHDSGEFVRLPLGEGLECFEPEPSIVPGATKWDGFPRDRSEGVYAIGDAAREHWDQSRAWLRPGTLIGDAFADGVQEYRLNRDVERGDLITTEDLVPTPDAQAANLARIAGTPRPTTVEVREMLFDLERSAQWLGGESQTWGSDWICGAAGYDGKMHAVALRNAAATIDRLAVEVLMLDRVIDDQQRQISRLSTNPPAGPELSRLLANLTVFMEREGNPPRQTLLAQAKAALVDHMREVEDLRKLIREAAASVDLAGQLATMTDTECDFLDGAGLREAFRCALANQPFTLPRLYSDEDRSRASDMLREYIDMNCAFADSIVDGVANALGMRRAGE
jgi:hypothetical protein